MNPTYQFALVALAIGIAVIGMCLVALWLESRREKRDEDRGSTEPWLADVDPNDTWWREGREPPPYDGHVPDLDDESPKPIR